MLFYNSHSKIETVVVPYDDIINSVLDHKVHTLFYPTYDLDNSDICIDMTTELPKNICEIKLYFESSGPLEDIGTNYYRLEIGGSLFIVDEIINVGQNLVPNNLILPIEHLQYHCFNLKMTLSPELMLKKDELVIRICVKEAILTDEMTQLVRQTNSVIKLLTDTHSITFQDNMCCIFGLENDVNDVDGPIIKSPREAFIDYIQNYHNGSNIINSLGDDFEWFDRLGIMINGLENETMYGLMAVSSGYDIAISSNFESKISSKIYTKNSNVMCVKHKFVRIAETIINLRLVSTTALVGLSLKILYYNDIHGVPTECDYFKNSSIVESYDNNKKTWIYSLGELSVEQHLNNQINLLKSYDVLLIIEYDWNNMINNGLYLLYDIVYYNSVDRNYLAKNEKLEIPMNDKTKEDTASIDSKCDQCNLDDLVIII